MFVFLFALSSFSDNVGLFTPLRPDDELPSEEYLRSSDTETESKDCASREDGVVGRLACVISSTASLSLDPFMVEEATGESTESRANRGVCTVHFEKRGFELGDLLNSLDLRCKDPALWCSKLRLDKELARFSPAPARGNDGFGERRPPWGGEPLSVTIWNSREELGS